MRWLARIGWGRVERAARGGATSTVIAAAAALVLLAALAALGAPGEAFARPGGGHGFSGGGGSVGGGGSSGGGGGGDGIFFLIWLCIRYPQVGIPLAVVVGLVWVVKNKKKKDQTDWATAMDAPAQHRASTAVSPRRTLERLRRHDPDFSLVVFDDFLYGLYQKAHELRGAGQLDHLQAYMSDTARQTLAARAASLSDVEGVVVGSMGYMHVGGVDDASASHVSVRVLFEANYTEVREGGERGSFYVAEHWDLARRRDAKSRPPEKARVFECPSCGAPLESVQGGTCSYCQSRVDTGDFDWVVTSVRLMRQEARPPALTGDVEERGTNLPTVRDPQAPARLQELQQRDPNFQWTDFEARVGRIHHDANAAWSRRDEKGLRPYVSDKLFETQLYWIQAYRDQGLTNVLEDARVTGIELAQVTSDRWYDAITVRVHAISFDYTVRDSDGRLVSGNRRRERPYTEYWTLIRGRSVQAQARSDANCPNCGAPLNVNQGGECEYCQAHVTTGDFDWVLSRIEQDEAYAG